MHRWASAALAAVLIGGAVDAATLPLSTINGFKIGQTTRAEALKSLGPPEHEQSNRRNGRTLVYTYTAPATPRTPGQNMLVMVVFDQRGVLLGEQAEAELPRGTDAGVRSSKAVHTERLILPLPPGYRVAVENGLPGEMKGTELRPESPDRWSTSVVAMTFYGRGGVDPRIVAAGVATSGEVGCPGASTRDLAEGPANGYPSSTWMFVCPREQASGQPASMFVKVVSGRDALYVIIYGQKRALTDSFASTTRAYLTTVTLCDARAIAQHCSPASR